MIIKKTETVPALMRGDGLFKGCFYIVRKPQIAAFRRFIRSARRCSFLKFLSHTFFCVKKGWLYR